MPSLTVTAHEKKLVARGTVIVAAGVQVVNPALKSLPLRLLALRVEALVGRVVPLQEAEVDLGLLMSKVNSVRSNSTIWIQHLYSRNQSHWDW